jgi:hypothetical protein
MDIPHDLQKNKRKKRKSKKREKFRLETPVWRRRAHIHTKKQLVRQYLVKINKRTSGGGERGAATSWTICDLI